MRVVKEAEERKNEILDAAEELFAEKGFDNTSTGDILEKVGIARGTLYYHFKSKEDILDGVIDRMTSGMAWKAREIAGKKEIPLLNRLTGIVMAFNSDTRVGEEVTKQIHKTQNALMHQKVQARLLAEIVPILSGLLEEGAEQGVFHTKFGPEAMEMVMLYAAVMFDDLMEQDMNQLQRRIQGFIYNIERLLGTEEGFMQEAVMAIFQGNMS